MIVHFSVPPFVSICIKILSWILRKKKNNFVTKQTIFSKTSSCWHDIPQGCCVKIFHLSIGHLMTNMEQIAYQSSGLDTHIIWAVVFPVDNPWSFDRTPVIEFQWRALTNILGHWFLHWTLLSINWVNMKGHKFSNFKSVWISYLCFHHFSELSFSKCDVPFTMKNISHNSLHTKAFVFFHIFLFEFLENILSYGKGVVR